MINKIKNKKKAIVMFSGGLDSCLTIKIMQKQNFDILAVFFKLPFVKDDEKKLKEFVKKEKLKLKIFDCTKGKLLQEYLKIIINPKYGRGAGVNPCIDCRIFMLKKAKKFADEKNIKIIATGEVLGQRPMSQHRRGLNIVEKESGLKERLFRPLIEEGIEGRRRDKQISLAKKFKIKYPSPAGGCLLCEKGLIKRLKFLLERGLNENEVKLAGIGRHFLIENNWIILGKNEKENKIMEIIGKKYHLIIPNFIGPSAVILTRNSISSKTKEKVNELIKIYAKKNGLTDRKKFDKYKL